MLERIRELGIPPAWKDVWICPYPMGHLQATGVDAAGRKQYLYHHEWRERRDREKFDEMVRVRPRLPELRERVRARPAARRARRASACSPARCGCSTAASSGSAPRTTPSQNESYGLATMRKEHVTARATTMVFDYPAKSGQRA